MGCTSLLIDLDGGLVGFNPNDLSHKTVVTHTDLETSTAACGSRVAAPTSSYMAHPIMFSAMMTGLGLSVCSSYSNRRRRTQRWSRPRLEAVSWCSDCTWPWLAEEAKRTMFNLVRRVLALLLLLLSFLHASISPRAATTCSTASLQEASWGRLEPLRRTRSLRAGRCVAAVAGRGGRLAVIAAGSGAGRHGQPRSRRRRGGRAR